MQKVKLSSRVPYECKRKIEALAATGGKTVSDQICKILEDYFDDRWEKAVQDTTLSMLGKIDKRTSLNRSDLESLAELQCFFIFHWFCHTPNISAQQKRLQYAEGRQRYQTFLRLLHERRGKGKSFASMIFESLASSSSVGNEEVIEEEIS